MTTKAKCALLSTMLCMVVVLSSCGWGGGDDKAGSASGVEEVASQRQAVTASTTLSDAMEGRILLTGSVGDTIMEPITGSWSVADDGSGSYRVPIWVPDGVAGMKPSLAIAYGSRAAPGLLGPRWNIAGISRIARCPMTLSGEGYKESVNYGGDEYCLDGAHLERTRGTPGLDGEEFRAQKNPYAKIVANVDSTNQTSFTVFQPDGRIFYYGRSDASRLFGHAGTYPNGTISPGSKEVLAWYIDKVVDRFNNSILYTYVTTPTPTTVHTTDLQPLQIFWGDTGDTLGQRSITFTYEGSSSDTVVGAHERFVAGMGVRSGAFLSSIDVRAPGGGTGQVPTLRTYSFSYGTQSITLERLLGSINECDAIGVCKLPTKITWEAGSFDYFGKDLTLDAGISDMMVTNPGPMKVTNPYQKIIVADLNSDGRDDIVYRANMPTAGLYTSCLGWADRWGGIKDTSPGSGYFSAAGQTNGTPNADKHCLAHQPVKSGTYANPADILVTHLDTTDNPETLLASTTGLVDGSVRSNSYTAYFPSGTYPYETDESIVSTDSQISIGDIDGDGAREVLRPMHGGTFSSGRLWAASLSSSSSGFVKTYRTIPDIPSSFDPINHCGSNVASGFAAVDLDGDGVAEILRDIHQWAPDCTFENVVVLTARGTTYPTGLAMPPQNPGLTSVGRETRTFSLRWFLDLNGDGLPDLAYVISTDPTTIRARINTGRGFLPEVSTTLSAPMDQVGPGWLAHFESGVRIADMDMDGRQDLVLVDPGAAGARTAVNVLLSDGNGGFTSLGLPVPIGDPADGWVQTTGQGHGYNTSVVLDYNGDGLPDILEVRDQHLWLYTRQGNVPDVVTNIAEGTGRNIAVSYSSVGDDSVFTADSSACSAANKDIVSCAAGNAHGMSLVASDTIYGGDTVIARSYKYTGSVFSRQGQGFLGFKTREIFGPAPSEHTTITYSPADAVTLAQAVGRSGLMTYSFEDAMTPMTAVTETNTRDVTHPYHYSYRAFSYVTNGNVVAPAADPARFSYWRLPSQSVAISYDASVPGAGPSDNGVRTLGESVESLVYDSYGNLTNRTVTNSDATGANMQSDVDTWTFDPADATAWIVAKLTLHTAQSTTPDSTVLRTTGFTTDPTTGVVTSVETEPSGDPSVHLLKCIGRDDRGRITSVLTQTTGSCDATPPADARQTTFAYEDADGVYVTTTTDALGHETREWRHPGLGVLVESDDPNGLASSASYDSFGRMVAETAITGASSTATYPKNAPAGQGSSYTISPEGKGTRAITFVVDPLGRESSRSWPIDARKNLSNSKVHDYAGRLKQRTTSSNSTALNTETFDYDDLGRLLSWCHLVSDGTIQCVTQKYDGLSMTRRDESGRETTRILDSMGRVSIERAELSTGTSDATFSYGPFNALTGESVEDGSGSTSIGYDVLGRTISLYRKGMAAPRMTTYNPYGELMSSYKLNASDGSQNETITYFRDQLGRVISETSAGGTGPNAPPGLNRHYYWDQTASGLAVPAGIGKLVDAVDSSFNVSTHFDYDNVSGLMTGKTWTLWSPLLGAVQSYALGYTYDAQGRVDTLTYPTIPGETTPFSVKYAYDAYTGKTASLTDPSNPARPLWATASRNEWGSPTLENMSFGAGTTITTSRSTSYYRPTGALNRSTICSYSDYFYLPYACSGPAFVSYTYQADGLPATIHNPTSLTSTYDYDNLGRLTSWHDDWDSRPVVNFAYDSDGNLTSRAWSTVSSIYGARFQTVTYGATFDANGVMTSHTLADQGSNQNDPTQVLTSTYAVDEFLRITSTPTLGAISYTDDDQFGNVIEASGQRDTLLYDAMGHRVVTFFGDPSQTSSWYRVTLDGVFELGGGKAYTAGPYGSCRLMADGKVLGDIWRKGTGAARTASFYLTNKVGTVVAEADGNSLSNAKARDNFDPFGNDYISGLPYLRGENSGDNTGPSSRFGFAGHDRDTFYPASPAFGRESWGTVDMLARTYNPRLGQFFVPDTLVPDPLDRRDYNPLAYARNAPTALSDPSGHGDMGTDGDNGNNGAGGAGGGASPGANNGTGGMGGNPGGGQEGMDGGGSPQGAGGAGGGAPSGGDFGQSNAGGRNGSDEGRDPGGDEGPPVYNSPSVFETIVIDHRDVAPVNPSPPGAPSYNASQPTMNVSVSGGVASGSSTGSGIGGAKAIQSAQKGLASALKYVATDPDMKQGLQALGTKTKIVGGLLTLATIAGEDGEQRNQDLAGAAGALIAGAMASGATSAAATGAGDAVVAALSSAGAGVDAALAAGAAAAAATGAVIGGGVAFVGFAVGSWLYSGSSWIEGGSW